MMEELEEQKFSEIDVKVKCDHEFVAKEFPSQLYGTCLCCGSTIFEN